MAQPVQQQAVTQQPMTQQPMQGQQQVQQAQFIQMPMGAPIIGQQQPVVWVQSPGPVAGCPPGLEYLTVVDQLIVKQQIDLFEMMTNVQMANKYKIENSAGQQVYFATEESELCNRQCCGPRRGFVMHITDNLGQEVMKLEREFKCCALCAWCAKLDCCGNEIRVECPPGQTVGYIRQGTYFQKAHFFIQDEQKNDVCKLEGPCCICQGVCCPYDQEFIATSCKDGSEIGKVSKQWTGLAQELLTNADNFGVIFPMDLDVKVKACFIGAVFMLDFMFFEVPKNRNGHGGRRRGRRR